MKSKRWVILITAIVISLVFAGIAYAGAETSEQKAADEKQEDKSYRDEDYDYTDLLEFTAVTLDGNEFTQDDLKKVDLTLLYFWSGTCGYCVEALPELAKLDEELPSNVQIITYCLEGEESPDIVKKMLDRRGLDAVTLVSGDGDFELLSSQLMYTPTTLFLDSEGYLAYDPYIGEPKDLVQGFNEIIDEILEIMGKERLEKPETPDNK